MKTDSLKLTPALVERGDLLQWAEAQAVRISQLDALQPHRWTAVGCASIRRGLRKQLLGAGLGLNWADSVIQDILDMARLKATARTNR